MKAHDPVQRDALFPRFGEVQMPRFKPLDQHRPFLQLAGVLGENTRGLGRKRAVDMDRGREQRALGEKKARVAFQFLGPLDRKGRMHPA